MPLDLRPWRLLMLIEDLVTRACEEQYITRSEFRFSRRDVREHTQWGMPPLCG